MDIVQIYKTVSNEQLMLCAESLTLYVIVVSRISYVNFPLKKSIIQIIYHIHN